MTTEEKINYKVCILTAGIGSRLGNRTTYFNKALLRVGNKAVISHVIDEFPVDAEFVIALGYKGELIKQYLQMFHPERKFTYVDVDKYSVPGSGPGYALLRCETYLQCPFYFFSSDTIISRVGAFTVSGNYEATHEDLLTGEVFTTVANEIDLFSSNFEWVAYDKIEQELAKNYCTFEIQNNIVRKFYDKSVEGTDNAFVGAAYIIDYQSYWHLLNLQTPSTNQEIQVAPVFLSTDLIKAAKVQWFDTGCEEGLQKAREHFKGVQNLDKVDEEIYFKDSSVIKYFHNESMVKNRVSRATKLGSTIPKILNYSKNYYEYEFVEGKDLFKLPHQHEVMLDLLEYTKNNLWTDVKLKNYDELIFNDVCRNFYYDKTIARLNKLYDSSDIKDEEVDINYKKVPSVKYMFDRIDWKDLCKGTPSNFHGDWNFSNIVIMPDRQFKFLDWRQDFGGLIDYGDRYYDFAKMFASINWSHVSIKNGNFDIKENKERGVWCRVGRTIALERCDEILVKWLFDNGYDVRKVRILTSIVWLNMAVLHEPPLNKHLYYWGKYHLYKSLMGMQW